MERIIKNLDLTFIDFLKFLVFGVLPLVVWFLSIRHEIGLNSLNVDANRVKIEYIRDKQDIFNNKILDKLDTIQEQLSEVRGQLKR